MVASDSSVELVTAEQLEGIEIPGKTVELVRGRLVIGEPPGFYHGVIAGRLARWLGEFVEERSLGFVVGEAGFRIASNPDTVRAPDVSFVSRSRLTGTLPRGFAPLAPDLAAEIISPSDRRPELLAKVADWLAAGVKVVWVVDPESRSAQVFRADGSIAVVAEEGMLRGDDVLPGFTCSMAQLLD